MTTRRSVAFTLSLACLSGSCGQPFFRPHPTPPAPSFVPPESSAAILEISLDQRGCLGPCPEYRFVLRRSGGSDYQGGRFAAIQGRYEAVVDSATFDRLAQLLLKRRFFTMDSVQGIFIDAPSTRIAAVLVDSRQKWVAGYQASSGFLEIAEAIDSVGAHLSWKALAR